MAVFVYKAYHLGQIEKGQGEGDSKEQVLRGLKEKGYTVIEIKKLSLWKREIVFKHKVSKMDVAFFCRQLYFFINNGVSLFDLETIAQDCKNPLKKEILKIQSEVTKGSSLSNSIERSGKFPSLFTQMVKLGEKTGRLDTVLAELEIHYEKEARLQKEIISMLMYPLFILCVMVMLIGFSIVFLIPNFTQIFESQNIELPRLTKMMLSLGNVVSVQGGIITIASSFLLIVFLRRYWHKYCFYLPVIKNVLRQSMSARFTWVMYMVSYNAINLLEGLDLVESLFKNKTYRAGIQNIKKDVTKGESISQSVKKQVCFLPMLVSFMVIGERTGHLEESYHGANVYFEKEYNYTIARLKRQIEPVLTIVLGIALLFLALAIMLPTFTLTELI